ncbi:hypothetical protein LTR36_000520 [Oleoguttula mirabilis]|uniref:Uncharacterized protein n=1 Tax=Oleoguttula mirabilis TaxID=1507867 RepID=A0AAV9JQ44_9PEZI|nr:hypothetical protein LTR36_000520 [Oleoguttula mirabilis]
MAKQQAASTTKRALRPRNANGLAKTSLPSDGTTTKADIAAKPKPKPQTQAATVAGKAAAAAKVAKPSKIPKTAEEPAAASKSKSKRKSKAPPAPHKEQKPSKLLQQMRAYQATRDRRRREWFVLPAYATVNEIPAQHEHHYAALLSGHPTDFLPSSLVPSLPGTMPPQLRAPAHQPGQAQQAVVLRARYQVVDGKVSAGHGHGHGKTGGGGLVRCRCVQEGWGAAHSRGKEVWVDAERVLMAQGLKGRKHGMLLAGDNVMLGWVMSNSGEGVWGKRDLSGEPENNTEALDMHPEVAYRREQEDVLW